MSEEVPRGNPRFCGNCGQKLLEGATFCAYCGAQVPKIVTGTSPDTRVGSMHTPTIPISPYPGPQAYQPPYQTTKKITEPALPFFQHFQGVLISPQKEMPRIVKRPNLLQPFLVVLVAAIFSALALYITISRTTIHFSDEFYSNLGYTQEMLAEIDEESLAQIMGIMIVLSSPLGFLINWIIINTLILWCLHAIISTQIPSHERNFRTIATITGWSFLPRIFEELINIVSVFLLVDPKELTLENIYEIGALETLGLPEEFSIIFLLITLVCIIWSVIIVYFGSKSIDPEGSHAIIIAIGYAIIPFGLSFFLSGFIPI